ncbi:MAG: terminase small subunit [Pseudomonadota bacterium]
MSERDSSSDRIDGLTSRQRMFAEAYADDPARNAKNAALKAGYSQRSAHVQAVRLLKNANVRHAINERVRENSKTVSISPEWVVQETMRQYQKADQAGERNNALKALDLASKFLAMQTTNVIAQHTHRYDDMNEQELAESIKGDLAELGLSLEEVTGTRH